MEKSYSTQAVQNRILRKKAVRDKTGLPISTIYYLISKNKFPRQIPLGGVRSVGWLESDIDQWINDRLAEAGREVTK